MKYSDKNEKELKEIIANGKHAKEVLKYKNVKICFKEIAGFVFIVNEAYEVDIFVECSSQPVISKRIGCEVLGLFSDGIAYSKYKISKKGKVKLLKESNLLTHLCHEVL